MCGYYKINRYHNTEKLRYFLKIFIEIYERKKNML